MSAAAATQSDVQAVLAAIASMNVQLQITQDMLKNLQEGQANLIVGSRAKKDAPVVSSIDADKKAIEEASKPTTPDKWFIAQFSNENYRAALLGKSPVVKAELDGNAEIAALPNKLADKAGVVHPTARKITAQAKFVLDALKRNHAETLYKEVLDEYAEYTSKQKNVAEQAVEPHTDDEIAKVVAAAAPAATPAAALTGTAAAVAAAPAAKKATRAPRKQVDRA